MPENDVTPEMSSPTQPQGVQAESSASASGQDVSYWKDKYTGQKGYITTLQRQVEELSHERENLSKRLEVSTVEAETQLNQTRAELDAYLRKVQDLEPRYQQLEQQHKQLSRQTEIGKVVRTEYPALTGLFDKGLLDVGEREGDELTNYLQNYAEELGQLRREGVKDAARGSTPPAPQAQPNPATPNPVDAQRAVSRALEQHGIRSQQYQAAMSEYMDMLRNSGA